MAEAIPLEASPFSWLHHSGSNFSLLLVVGNDQIQCLASSSRKVFHDYNDDSRFYNRRLVYYDIEIVIPSELNGDKVIIIYFANKSSFVKYTYLQYSSPR